MKKLTQCSDQFSDAARTNEGLTMKSFSVLLPTLLMLIILHAASLGLWVRPYPVPKATCKSVDSCCVLWRSMSYLDDLFVFQEICILYKDSFTQYSGKVKGLLGSTWKWVLTQPNFFFLIKARILERSFRLHHSGTFGASSDSSRWRKRDLFDNVKCLPFKF